MAELPAPSAAHPPGELGPTDEELREIVGMAVRAPSLHNTQPWRFRLGDGGIDVLADADRTLPIADPDGWAVRVAGGAALFNARLGYHRFGWEPALSLLPEVDAPDLLARILPRRRRPASPAELDLIAAVPRRHSNRHPFLDAPLPAAHLAALAAAASTEGAWLAVLDHPGQVSDVATLVRQADRELGSRPGYLQELRAWGRMDGRAADGVPHDRSGPPLLEGELLPRRDFGTTAGPTHRRFESDPVLAVLGTHGHSPADDVRAGCALQRVLLAVTTHGLVASMFSQPVEVPDTRDKLTAICGRQGTAHMVLRIGYGIRSSSPARRSIDEVITPPAEMTP